MSKPTMRFQILLFAATPAAAGQGAAPKQVQQLVQLEDDAAVDDIVLVTASRSEEQLLNAPATMSVLAEDVIGNAPGQSVTDLLRLVPGLNTVQSSAIVGLAAPVHMQSGRPDRSYTPASIDPVRTAGS